MSHKWLCKIHGDSGHWLDENNKPFCRRCVPTKDEQIEALTKERDELRAALGEASCAMEVVKPIVAVHSGFEATLFHRVLAKVYALLDKHRTNPPPSAQ